MVGGVAGLDLGQLLGGRRGQAEAGPRQGGVLGALHVDHAELHAALGEPGVLRQADLVLRVHRPGLTQGAVGHRVEDLPERVEALERVVGTVVGPVAVRPVVVARGQHERVRQAVELPADHGEVLVGAHGGTGLDVPDVGHEGELVLRGELVDHPGERGHLRGAVGHVADHAEGEGLRRRPLADGGGRLLVRGGVGGRGGDGGGGRGRVRGSATRTSSAPAARA